MTTIEKIFGLKEFTGWHMAGVMVLFFGTIIGVNFTMAYFATSTWTGLVVQNSYVESQRFNEVTAEKKRQAALGWSTQIAYEGGVLAAELTDKDGAAIPDAIVLAKIGHPVQQPDRDIALARLKLRQVARRDAGQFGYHAARQALALSCLAHAVAN